MTGREETATRVGISVVPEGSSLSVEPSCPGSSPQP